MCERMFAGRSAEDGVLISGQFAVIIATEEMRPAIFDHPGRQSDRRDRPDNEIPSQNQAVRVSLWVSERLFACPLFGKGDTEDDRIR